MRIVLDVDRLTSLGMTPADVVAALKAQNVQAAIGRIGAQPMTDDPLFQLNLQTQGRLTDPAEFANVVLRAEADGSFVRIRDVAKVELGAASSDTSARYNGKPTAMIGTYQAPGANALAAAEGVKAAMERLAKSFPEGLAYNITYDTSQFVQASVTNVVHTLVEAFILVILVVFIFLGRCPRDAHSARCRAGGAGRHFRGHARHGLLSQHGVVAGAGAGHRHRRRRRHRRGRECRARDGGKSGHAGGRSGAPRDGRDHRSHRGDHSRIAVGVRAGGIHTRPERPAFPAIRGRGLGIDGAFGHLRADLEPGTCARSC